MFLVAQTVSLPRRQGEACRQRGRYVLKVGRLYKESDTEDAIVLTNLFSVKCQLKGGDFKLADKASYWS